MKMPLVTVAVPSFNQGQFLEDALTSIFRQNIPVEVFVMDGGSTDDSLKIIKRWEPHLAGWRSHEDAGQSAAINEGILQGRAPYVCWMNSDDWFLDDGLAKLVNEINKNPGAPFVYGWNFVQKSGKRSPVYVEPFNETRLAWRCIISQPGTLIRRSSWEIVGGLDETLEMAMDYDLWWRLFKRAGGGPCFLDDFVAVNREHQDTKTKNQRRRHYREAMQVIRKYYGSVPIKWWLAQPYSVWYKSICR